MKALKEELESKFPIREKLRPESKPNSILSELSLSPNNNDIKTCECAADPILKNNKKTTRFRKFLMFINLNKNYLTVYPFASIQAEKAFL